MLYIYYIYSTDSWYICNDVTGNNNNNYIYIYSTDSWYICNDVTGNNNNNYIYIYIAQTAGIYVMM